MDPYIKNSDLFLANRGNKTGKVPFSLLSESVLAGTIYISNNAPTEGVVDGSVWMNTTATPPTLNFYDKNSGQFVEQDLGGAIVVIADTEPNASDYKVGDIWFNESTTGLSINNGSSWEKLLPDSIGSLDNVAIEADSADVGDVLVYRNVDDSDASMGQHWTPEKIDIEKSLGDLTDVYLEEFTPQPGDSLVYSDNLFGNGTEGWYPKKVEVRGGGLKVSLREDNPNPQTLADGSRFTNKSFTATYTPDGLASPSYKLRAYVEGQIDTEVPAPTGAEGGLRFDSIRKTRLHRKSIPAKHENYTLSVWYKQTASAKPNNLLWVGTNSEYYVIGVSSDKFQVTRYVTGAIMDFDISSFKITNKWTHFVLQQDWTSDKLKLFINGQLVNSVAPIHELDFNMGGGQTSIGHWVSSSIWMDGYLSDYYLVTDEVLQPSTFGNYYPSNSDPNKVWVPTESDVVKSNISSFGDNGFYLPFKIVNGSDLTEHSSIGEDDSGKGNTFEDEGFIYNKQSFDVYSPGDTNSGSSAPKNISVLSKQDSGVDCYHTGGNATNHLTADFGSVGYHHITGGDFISAKVSDKPKVFISDDGIDWKQIGDTAYYSFNGRYIQFVRAASGYGNEVLYSPYYDTLPDTPLKDYAILGYWI